MSELSTEQERYEYGALPRESNVFSAEMLAIRGLVDAIGSFVVLPVDNSNGENCGKRKLVVDENEVIEVK